MLDMSVYKNGLCLWGAVCSVCNIIAKFPQGINHIRNFSFYTSNWSLDHTIIWICPSVFNEVSWWASYYKMTISLYAWESGWKPHWQGASKINIEKKCFVGPVCPTGAIFLTQMALHKIDNSRSDFAMNLSSSP